MNWSGKTSDVLPSISVFRRTIAASCSAALVKASRYWLAHDRVPDVDTLATQLSQLAWSGLRGVRSYGDADD